MENLKVIDMREAKRKAEPTEEAKFAVRADKFIGTCQEVSRCCTIGGYKGDPVLDLFYAAMSLGFGAENL